MLRVLKFGGSCLCGADGFRSMGEIIRNTPGRKVVVISAVKDSTNHLRSYLEERSRQKLTVLREKHLEIARELLSDEAYIDYVKEVLDPELCRVRELLDRDDEAVPRWLHDHVVTFGERMAVKLAGAFLTSTGVPSVPLGSEDVGIMAIGEFGGAEADLPTTQENLTRELMPILGTGKVPLVTGFYGVLPDGRTATFGRNGSDYVASVIARSIHASELVLYKDVKGFMSADPSIVPDAVLLEEITIQEGIELSQFGARIVHPKTFYPLIGSGIPVRIADMNDPGSTGTRMISSKCGKSEGFSVAFRTALKCIRISVRDCNRSSDVLCSAYGVLAEKGIEVISVLDLRDSIGIVACHADGARAMVALEDACIQGVERIEVREDLAMIGLIGEDLVGMPNVLDGCFLALGDNGIAVRMSGPGGTRSAYYFIVDEDELSGAVRTLHRICRKAMDPGRESFWGTTTSRGSALTSGGSVSRGSSPPRHRPEAALQITQSRSSTRPYGKRATSAS